jgi:hypothetical protein
LERAVDMLIGHASEQDVAVAELADGVSQVETTALSGLVTRAPICAAEAPQTDFPVFDRRELGDPATASVSAGMIETAKRIAACVVGVRCLSRALGRSADPCRTRLVPGGNDDRHSLRYTGRFSVPWESCHQSAGIFACRHRRGRNRIFSACTRWREMLRNGADKTTCLISARRLSNI